MKFKKVFLWLLTICFLFIQISPADAKTVLSKKQAHTYLETIAGNIIKSNPNPSVGSTGGEWAITGLARAGLLPDDYRAKYLENLDRTLAENEGVLHKRKYTEYSRVVIALTALGLNAEDYQGYNLIRPLAQLDSVKKQGVNGLAYALIAFDCGNYTVPAAVETYEGAQTTRNALVTELLQAQLEDGGWNNVGEKANADMTAMVLQSLAPYYLKEARVKNAVEQAVLCLSKLQLQDGSFASGSVKNCESTAQVLTALSEIGINIEDARFIKSGNTLLDGLFQYYRDGGFCHLPDGSVNQMATEQAMYALAAYERSISGEEGLYEISKDTKLETKNDEKKVTGRNKTSKKAAKQKKKGNQPDNREAATEKKTPAAAFAAEETLPEKTKESDSQTKNKVSPTKARQGGKTKESMTAAGTEETVSDGEMVVQADAEPSEHQEKEDGNVMVYAAGAAGVLCAAAVIFFLFFNSKKSRSFIDRGE